MAIDVEDGAQRADLDVEPRGARDPAEVEPPEAPGAGGQGRGRRPEHQLPPGQEVAERQDRGVVTPVAVGLVHVQEIVRHGQAFRPPGANLVGPQGEARVVVLPGDEQAGGALLRLDVPREQRHHPGAGVVGAGGHLGRARGDGELGAQPQDLAELDGGIAVLAAPEPQVVVPGHEEDVGELPAETAEDVRELCEVVAHVPGQQQRVAQVSTAGKTPHALHVLRVVHVHVRQGEDPHGFTSAASGAALRCHPQPRGLCFGYCPKGQGKTGGGDPARETLAAKPIP